MQKASKKPQGILVAIESLIKGYKKTKRTQKQQINIVYKNSIYFVLFYSFCADFYYFYPYE